MTGVCSCARCGNVLPSVRDPEGRSSRPALKAQHRASRKRARLKASSRVRWCDVVCCAGERGEEHPSSAT
eukprot:scaffold13210_cov109-Isochrysis_galbana.AAC.6